MIDNRGLTDEEIQKLIDWEIMSKKINEQMWEQHAADIIRKIVYDNLREDIDSQGIKN